MRRLSLVVGVVLVLMPAFFVLRLFAELYPGRSVVALALVYGGILAGVINQRRRGRVGGHMAFRGAMQFVIIIGAIGFCGPFVYAALTNTPAGNMAPIWGVLVMIFGSMAAVGAGLVVYGTQ